MTQRISMLLLLTALATSINVARPPSPIRIPIRQRQVVM